MTNRDDDTKAIRREDVFDRVGVTVTECELKRGDIIDLVNDALDYFDRSWRRTLAVVLAFILVTALATCAALLSVRNHQRLELLEKRLQPTKAEYRGDTTNPKP